MLKLEDVHAKYGEVEVLKGIDLEVKDGQYVAIIGANGHGKTTILRTVTGLLKASSGKVLLDGEDITHLRPYKLSVKVLVHVPESSRLLPQMTVEENLLAGAYGSSAWSKSTKNLERVLQIFPLLFQRKK